MITYLMIIETPADQSKFERIYLHYKGLMYHAAYKILHNEEDAEDAVQNAFVKIAENISKIEKPVCPKTQRYIVTIVENKAIDLYRSNRRRNSVKYIDDLSGIAVESDSLHGLAACMAKLPARYREVILMKYHHGFRSKEIARLMRISEANAIKLDQRAKNKLYQLCKEEGVL